LGHPRVKRMYTLRNFCMISPHCVVRNFERQALTSWFVNGSKGTSLGSRTVGFGRGKGPKHFAKDVYNSHVYEAV
jgi:hypothetical protein